MEGDFLIKPNLATEEGGGQGPRSLSLLVLLRRSDGGGLVFLPLSAAAPRTVELGGFTINRGLVTTSDAPVRAAVAGEGAVDGAAGTL